MSRYIDADTLKAEFTGNFAYSPAYIITVIDSATTVDAEPVRHGYWEFLGPNKLNQECFCGTCSECKVRSKYIENTMICPNCGAKMDR